MHFWNSMKTSDICRLNWKKSNNQTLYISWQKFVTSLEKGLG